MSGTPGNDSITVTSPTAGTVISGGDGNDTIHVFAKGPGADLITLDGGPGTDVLQINGNGVTTIGAAGDVITGFEVITFGSGSSYVIEDSIVGAGESITISSFGADLRVDASAETNGAFRFQAFGSYSIQATGGAGNDTFVGGNSVDRAFGGGGNDLIQLGQGSDTAFYAGARSAYSVTQSGSGYIVSGPEGVDTLSGVDFIQFQDTVLGIDAVGLLSTGGSGNDTITGGDGGDTLSGGGGEDWLYGFDGNDRLDGGADNDRIFGGAGNDTLIGGTGHDVLSALDGNDVISGGAGNDRIEARNNTNSTIYGGDGDDSIAVSGGTAGLVVSGGDGNDTIELSSPVTGGLNVNGGAGSDVLRVRGSAGLTTLGAAGDTIAGFTRIELAQAPTPVNVPSTDPDYALADSLLGAGQTITVTSFENSLQVDASAETDGNYIFIGLGSNAINVTGGAGDDTISGTNAADRAFGGHGNDLISLGQGADTVVYHGVQGSYSVTTSGDTTTVSGAEGVDTLIGVDTIEFQGNTTPLPNPGRNLTGTTGDDSITGSDGPDTLFGLAGNDTLNGFDGNDRLSGGADNDRILGGTGNDTLVGGAGHDVLSALDGHDVLSGGAGNDRIEARNNTNSTIYGGDGDDSIAVSGGTAGLVLMGGDGNDTVELSSFRQGGLNVDAGAGTDVLRIRGAPGTSTIGAAGDTIAGFERLEFAHSTVATVSQSYVLGDSIVGAGQSLTVTSYEGGLRVDGSAETNGTFNFIALGSNALTVTGGAGNDTFAGSASNDRVFGGAGNDLIELGQGSDTAAFSGIRSSYLVTKSGDTVTVVGADGTDTLTGVDVLEFQDESALTSGIGQLLSGTTAGEQLSGGSDDDTISGVDGADTLLGGAGNDVFRFATGEVVAGESIDGGLGSDTLYVATSTDFSSTQAISGIEAIGTAAGAVATFTGVFDGSSVALLGQGSFVFHSASPLNLSGLNVSGLTAGTNAITMIGSGAGEVLRAPAFGTTISGGGGDDALYGGSGADLFDGGAGVDVYVIAPGGGADTVASGAFVIGTDKLDLRALGVTGPWGVSVTDEGGSAKVAYGSQSVLLTGVASSQVTNASFIFAEPDLGGGGGGSSGGGSSGSASVSSSVSPSADGTRQTATISNSGGAAGSTSLPQPSGVASVVTVSLPASTVVQAEGPTSAQQPSGAGSFVSSAVSSRVTAGSDDSNVMTIGTNRFIGSRSASAVIDVRVLTLTTSGSAPGDPIVISGSSDTSSEEMFVLDTRSLPSGSILQIDNVEFVAVTGQATLTGGAGAQMVVADGNSQFISLGADDDTLFGGSGSDTVASAGGDDVLYGNLGADMVVGGEGNDSLYGGQGTDQVYGNLGADSILGGEGADTAFGGQDADVVYGNLGDDALHGNLGDDVLYGGQGADLVYGNAGADTLYGNVGSDVLYGGQGADLIVGAAGDDTIYTGVGDDTVTLGDGADLLVLADGGGIDSIADFQGGSGDRVLIASNGSGIDSFAELQAAATGTAEGNTEIDLGGGNKLVLIGVRVGELQSDWFNFG